MSESDLSAQQFLTGRQRDRPVVLPGHLSDEELARDWTLTIHDLDGIASFTKQYRLVNAVQLRIVRLFGRFLRDPAQIPPKIVAYIATQLGQPTPLTVQAPMREATLLEQQRRILQLVGFRRFDDPARSELEAWLEDQARRGDLPAALFERAERRLLRHRIVLPGPTTLERLVIAVCARSQKELFESIHAQLSPELRLSIDALLTSPEGEQRSFFRQLKEYPPSPTIKSMNRYLERYREVQDLFLDGLGMPAVDPAFADYLSQIAGGYSAKDIKRFQDEKRHALMACFLHESRKVVLDHLVEMHDKFMLNMCRDAKSAHETQYRALRKRQKAAIEAVMRTTAALLDWPQDEPRTRDDFWGREDEQRLRDSLTDLKVFQRLEERGYGDRLLARYPVG